MATLTNSDREKLLTFLRYAYEFVRKHIEDGGDLSRDIEIDKEMREPLRRAWAEYEDQFPLEEIEVAMSNTPLEAFVAAGLTKEQLSAKCLSREKNSHDYQKHGGQKRFQKLIQVIDKFLESFPSVVPGIEALTELKDVMAENINSPWFRFLTIDISSKPIRAMKRLWKKVTGQRTITRA